MDEHDLLWEHINRVQTSGIPVRWLVARHTQAWRPNTDVYETDDAVIVRVEVAGMQDSDFRVELQGRVLTINGARVDPCPKVAYHQMEIHYGEFQVEVYLHWAVDPDMVEASYADGFLQIRLPKLQARKVRVASAQAGRGGEAV